MGWRPFTTWLLWEHVELRVTVVDSQTIKAKNAAKNDSNNCLNNKTKKTKKNINQVSNTVQKFQKIWRRQPLPVIFSVLTLENIWKKCRKYWIKGLQIPALMCTDTNIIIVTYFNTYHPRFSPLHYSQMIKASFNLPAVADLLWMLLMCIAKYSAEHDLKNKSLQQNSQKQIHSCSVINVMQA